MKYFPLYTLCLLSLYSSSSGILQKQLVSAQIPPTPGILEKQFVQQISLKPDFKNLWMKSIEFIFGMTEKAFSNVVHELCSLLLGSQNIDPANTPKIDELFFQLRTKCKMSSFSISEAEQILTSPDFDVNKPVVLFISGWFNSIESDSIMEVARAFHCRGDKNFLALNASKSLSTLYTWSSYNTKAVGQLVAKGLLKLNNQIPAERIHIIGFSLGAHVAGFAGRYFKELTGKSIDRITGLDPANPCFNKGGSIVGLRSGDATHVDIIHTNPGALGEREATGDIDFYVEGYSVIKPGCILFSCSHGRAWQYYAESLYPGFGAAFPATHCSSARELEDGTCSGVKQPMSYSLAFSENGIYVVNANSKSPYGKGTKDERILSSKCGYCKNSDVN